MAAIYDDGGAFGPSLSLILGLGAEAGAGGEPLGVPVGCAGFVAGEEAGPDEGRCVLDGRGFRLGSGRLLRIFWSLLP